MTTAYERALATSAKTSANSIPSPGDTPAPFDLYAIHRSAKGDLIHNANDNGAPPLDDAPPTPFAAIVAEIDDLYGEAKNWADGEPISSPEVAEQVTALYNGLHAAGKKADELRVDEKKPHDDAADAVQAKFKPYVDPKSGKVALGKSALGDLLTAWRTKVAEEKAAAAAKAREDADKVAAEAQAAIRASSGNLEAREQAEKLLDESKRAGKIAARADKAATTGLGLRTVWAARVEDPGAALDWAYEKHPQAFIDLVQSLADTAVLHGTRSIPGFVIVESKVAR